MQASQPNNSPDSLDSGLITNSTCSGEIDGREEVNGEAVVSGCDSSENLEASEYALDGPAVTAEVGEKQFFQRR